MVNTGHFIYNLKRVTLVHIALFALFFLVWGVSVLFSKIRKKPPLEIPVNFVLQPAPQENQNRQKMLEPTPEKEVVPKETIYKKPEIKVSTKKIVRQKKTEQQPKKHITEDIIKKELASVSTSTYTLSEEQKNLLRIRNVLYRTWQQPSKATVGDSKVTLQINLDSNGKIVSSKLVGSSGNKFMDKSVLAAASRVGSVPGLTKEFLRRNKKVTISFRVE